MGKLGRGFFYFMYVGSSAEFHQSPEATTTTAGRADFIRGIVDSCAETRRGNPQMPTPFMETEFYCRCFGEKLAPLMTVDDVRGFDGGIASRRQLRGTKSNGRGMNVSQPPGLAAKKSKNGRMRPRYLTDQEP
jgi:hypothetical protein